MAALLTIDDYVADARVLLQDVIAPYRYTDAELLIAMNGVLIDTRRLRPDLFLGDGTTTTLSEVQSFDTLNADEVDLEQGFRSAVLYGLCGHAMARDQEDVQDARAASFMKLWRDKLMTLDI